MQITRRAGGLISLVGTKKIKNYALQCQCFNCILPEVKFCVKNEKNDKIENIEKSEKIEKNEKN